MWVSCHTLAGIDVLVLCSAAHESEPVLPCADLSGWCEEDCDGSTPNDVGGLRCRMRECLDFTFPPSIDCPMLFFVMFFEAIGALARPRLRWPFSLVHCA